MTRAQVTAVYVGQRIVAHDGGRLAGTEAAKAKRWSTQVQSEVLDHCVQLHGGYGYMNEQQVARLARRARDQDLGGLERDHEGARRARSLALPAVPEYPRKERRNICVNAQPCFQGRDGLITGATRGIGLATA